jgi:hypothetical protein
MQNTATTRESSNSQVISSIQIRIHAQAPNPVRVESQVLASRPAVSRSHEPLETDGPATCLLYV